MQLGRFVGLCAFAMLWANNTYADEICSVGQYLNSDNTCTVADTGYYASDCAKRAPNEYVKLRYIQSTGPQYIDTGLTINKEDNFAIEYVMSVDEKTNNVTTWVGANAYLQLWINRAGYSIQEQGQQFPHTERDVVKTTYDNTTEKLYINGELKQTKDWSHKDLNNVKIALLRLGHESNSLHTWPGPRIKLYSARIWQDSILVRNFIPALRTTDGAIGMYDTVTEAFYPNQSTTALIAGHEDSATDITIEWACTSQTICDAGHYCTDGIRKECSIGNFVGHTGATQCYKPDVGYYATECKDVYKQLEYIQSSGTQYIDTGLYATKNGNYALEYVLSSDSTSNGWTGAVAFLQMRIDATGYTLRAAQQVIPYNRIDNIKIIYENYIETLYLNNKQVQSHDWQGHTANNNTKIALMHIGGRENSKPETLGLDGIKSKLYMVRLWKDSVLVRNFIPVRRTSDNTIGMLDTIELKFYPNSGSGKFTASEQEYDYQIGIGCTNQTPCHAGAYCLKGIIAACNAGTWSNTGATECTACTNAPENTIYTQHHFPNAQCPWECDNAHSLTSVNTCTALCGIGINRIKNNTGIDIPLFATKNTSPALAVGDKDSVCYADLVEGRMTNTINIQYKDRFYHAM